MKAGLYPHLAMTGIKKNRRFYLPFIFTCAGMIMMSYIIEFLSVMCRVAPTRKIDLDPIGILY